MVDLCSWLLRINLKMKRLRQFFLFIILLRKPPRSTSIVCKTNETQLPQWDFFLLKTEFKALSVVPLMMESCLRTIELESIWKWFFRRKYKIQFHIVRKSAKIHVSCLLPKNYSKDRYFFSKEWETWCWRRLFYLQKTKERRVHIKIRHRWGERWE